MLCFNTALAIPSMFITATPVHVASKATGFSGFIRAYYSVF